MIEGICDKFARSFCSRMPIEFGPTFAFVKVVTYTEYGSWQHCPRLDLNLARGQIINVLNCGNVEQKLAFEIFMGFSPWWWQSASRSSLSFYASIRNSPTASGL